METINFGFGSAALALFFFDSATFWASFALFGPFWAILLALLTHFCGWDQVFLEPSNVDYQFFFWNAALSVCFILAKFGACVGCFGVGVSLKHFFGTHLCRQSTLVLDVQPHLFVFNLTTFGAGASCTFWAIWAYFFGPLGLFWA